MIFSAFRYFLTESSIQSDLLYYKLSKEMVFRLIIHEFTKKSAHWNAGSRKYALYPVNFNDNIFVFKFAKIKNESILKPGEEYLFEEVIEAAEFVYLIIDTRFQIVLIQKKQSVFMKEEHGINIIKRFLSDVIDKRNLSYMINILPLPNKGVFWDTISEADELYTLKLKMNSPNMPFLGDKKTKEILNIIKDQTNNEEFTVQIDNKKGELKVEKGVFKEWIEYVLEVGGQYLLRYRKNGVKDLLNSSTDVFKIVMEDDFIEGLSSEELTKLEELTENLNKQSNQKNEKEL